ncbi:MAG: GFA family protein [Acidobacteriota bacterium]
MVATEQVLEGSCHCGRVRYRAVAPFGEMTNCHCTDCRKSHGAAFATYIEVPRERFSYVQGEGELHSFQAESGLQRYFCRNCGSIIWNGSSNPPEAYWITAGTLDTPIDRKPDAHIFIRSKVPWYDIKDDLPQHQAYPATEG